jgi:hypothetical protein
MGPDTLTDPVKAWGQLWPAFRAAPITNKVTVTSSLGTNTSGKEVVVQRIAYVTALPTSPPPPTTWHRS